MNTFPNAPHLLKGGIVLIDPEKGDIKRVIALQYNPDTLSRSLQIQAAGGEATGSQSEVLRLTGPPIETIKLDAQIDATDMLEFPEQNQVTARHGIQPELSALETMVYPKSDEILANHELAQRGTLEIVPMEAPMALFVWGKDRVLPVRLTQFSITEEAYDPALNPIRAKVSLSFRVLNINDLGFSHRGGSLFMVHQQLKERLAGKSPAATLEKLGIGGLL